MANHMFDRIRAHVPSLDKTFLTDKDRQLSYGELLQRSAKYAGALQALGVAPGDRVAVQIEKCVDQIALYLACLRTGAVLMPLNPAHGFILNFRRAALGQELDAYALLVSLVVTIVLLLGGGLYFRRVERTLADII